MIDINFIRNEPQKAKISLSSKGINPALIDRFLDLDEKWREATEVLDKLRAQRNSMGPEDRKKSKELKNKEKECEDALNILTKERDMLVLQIPNMPADNAPVGKDDTENVVIKTVGDKTKFDFEPKDYLSLTSGLIDIERASKVTGSRFGYIMGDLVLMEFALVRLAFEKLIPRGFNPVVPPVMVKPDVMKGMGKIKFIEEGDAFYLSEDDLYLAGSSEHTIGPMHMNEILESSELPKRYVGFSTCFRREAGSYGKDTKGILRVHQFDKIEMFSFTTPEVSEKEHLFLLERQEELMETLKIPYHVLEVCTGDMGFGDYRQFDIEAWLPGQGKYRETNSCSNTADFQARGVNIKYKMTNGKKDFVHMLNATAFAIGRTLIAIIENYQTKEGKIVVPEALRDYVGKSEISSVA